MFAHFGPNLQFPCDQHVSILRCALCSRSRARRSGEYFALASDWNCEFGGKEKGGPTFAKYLQTFSADAPRSWLKGQAAPA